MALFVCAFSLQNASAFTKKFNITPYALFAQKNDKLINANDLSLNSSDENLYETEDEDNLNTDISFLNFYQTFFAFFFNPKATRGFFASNNINKNISTNLYLVIHAIKI